MIIKLEVTEKYRTSAMQAARRGLAYLPLLPVLKGESGHHINNLFVIGIPTKAHDKCNGCSLKEHRKRVINWLKENDQFKYKLVNEALEIMQIDHTKYKRRK